MTDDSAFDWDLSDKTDIETQTSPPTRATSTVEGGEQVIHVLTDAIVQTDQRLTFLLNRSAEEKIRWNIDQRPTSSKEGVGVGVGGGAPPKRTPTTYADASCQTYVEVHSVAIQVDPSELRQHPGGGLSGGSTAKSARHQPYNFDELSDFSDADISTVHNATTSKTSSHKRRLVRGRDGTFLGSPDHSDPDEIILASDTIVMDSPMAVSPAPTQSDAGFQINMEVATVAASNTKDDMSSPVGHGQQKSLQLEDLVPLRTQKRLNDPPTADVQNDKGVQTEVDQTEEAGGFKAEPTTARKFQLIGDNPDLFDLVDSWVLDISTKRYKSLKKIVNILVDLIKDEMIYRGRENLIKIRSFYRWTTENIRLAYTSMTAQKIFYSNDSSAECRP